MIMRRLAPVCILALGMAVGASVDMARAADGDMCPTPPDRTVERDDLLRALAGSKNPQQGVRAANAVWDFWIQAPDAEAQELLERGMAKMREANYPDAERILDQLIAYCPDFPEAWNQRAFARFLSSRYDESLADINQTLKLEPAHFGALSGQAMIYLRQGRAALAQIALKRAVRINPWLQERAMIIEDPGTDI